VRRTAAAARELADRVAAGAREQARELRARLEIPV
jgi:hypothetical protein